MAKSMFSPVARVKKILNVDEDTHQVSNNASFVITIATVGLNIPKPL